jgi:chloride channel protein, CIC family
MMSCFGGISRAPLAVMLMVAEMTGSLSIITPAMVAVGISWLIVRQGDDTIYRSQLKSRADAPAQRLLAGLPLLAAIPTARAMAKPRVVLKASRGRTEAMDAMERAGLEGAPVVDGNGRFEGTVSRAARTSNVERRVIGDLADAGAPTVSANSRLDVALESLTEAPLSWVPVLDGERRVVGTLSISDVVRAYRTELVASAERLSEMGTMTGAALVTIAARSPIVGKTLRQAALPGGLLITSITRGDQTFVPNGDTEFAAGDQLSILGQPGNLGVLGEFDPRATPSA